MRLCLAIALLFALPVHAEEMVRSAIVVGVDEVTLAGKGLEVRKLEVGEKYGLAPGGRSVVYLSKGSMFLDGAPVTSADGVKFRSDDFVRVAGLPVRGEIEVRRNGRALIAINIVHLEDYLAAVLGSEMPASFPPEALRAQAVAARTYAVHKKIAAWGKAYHLGATVLHQVYKGTRAEDERTLSAVEATRGEVLVWKMEPIEAYFHSSCGGRTESGKDALGADRPYLQAADCPCTETGKHSWARSFSKAELKPLLKDVKDVKVVSRTETGRARRVQLSSGKEKRGLSGVEVRQILGYDKVRSLSFEVEPSRGGGFTVTGKGHGHGAGLCQWGAKAYAEKGWDYRQILAHYYEGAELRRMY